MGRGVRASCETTCSRSQLKLLPFRRYSRVKHRERQTFIRKNVAIDMTIITGDPNDMDSEEEAQYQIEVEIIDPTKVGTELYNVVYKIRNMLEIMLL